MTARQAIASAIVGALQPRYRATAAPVSTRRSTVISEPNASDIDGAVRQIAIKERRHLAPKLTAESWFGSALPRRRANTAPSSWTFSRARCSTISMMSEYSQTMSTPTVMAGTIGTFCGKCSAVVKSAQLPRSNNGRFACCSTTRSSRSSCAMIGWDNSLTVNVDKTCSASQDSNNQRKRSSGTIIPNCASPCPLTNVSKYQM